MHFLVVSGFHLVIVDNLLTRVAFVKNRKGLQTFVLCFFALTAGLAPPITRSLVNKLLTDFSKKMRLSFDSLGICLLTSTLLLIVQPSWVHSTSFHLSWISSIVLNIPIQSSLIKGFLFYVLLLPLILQFQLPSPLSPIIIFFFGIAFVAVLFPVSVLAQFIAPFRQLGDGIWSATIHILREVSQASEFYLNESHSRSIEGVIYVCAIQIFFLSLSVSWRRSLFFSRVKPLNPSKSTNSSSGTSAKVPS
ncbi:MAG: ComEC/Rec2 family competence protein [Bdellovibrionales bacterium]|nr:ComEC/Rec2 family competence protein [Bdellovibrionales bacterium]